MPKFINLTIEASDLESVLKWYKNLTHLAPDILSENDDEIALWLASLLNQDTEKAL